MKTVEARLDIEVFTHCPECDYLIDILNQNDTNGVNHNEEGWVISQACPDGNWMEKHPKFNVENVTCSRCKSRFNVKGLEW